MATFKNDKWLKPSDTVWWQMNRNLYRQAAQYPKPLSLPSVKN